MQDLKRLGKLNNIYATENEEEGMSLASLVTCNTQNGHLKWSKLPKDIKIKMDSLFSHETQKQDPQKALEVSMQFLLQDWYKTGVMLRTTERDKFFKKANSQDTDLQL